MYRNTQDTVMFHDTY